MSALVESVRAIRLHALGIVTAADSLLRAAETVATAPAVAPDGPCAHPMADRTLAPGMGAPDRWVCGACGQEG